MRKTSQYSMSSSTKLALYSQQQRKSTSHCNSLMWWRGQRIAMPFQSTWFLYLSRSWTIDKKEKQFGFNSHQLQVNKLWCKWSHHLTVLGHKWQMLHIIIYHTQQVVSSKVVLTRQLGHRSVSQFDLYENCW